MRKPSWVRSAEAKEHARNIRYEHRHIVRRCSEGDFTDFRRINFTSGDVMGETRVLRLIEDELHVGTAEARALLSEWRSKAPAAT